jgi:uncharacterized protein
MMHPLFKYYLFNFQVTPSLVSFTSKPASARASRIWSLVAQSLSALALARRLRTISTTLPNAGSATRVLDELEQSDFIRRYTSFGQKKRDEMYQLTDAYTLFYFHFLQDGKNNDKQFWQHHLGTPKINSWAGYAFEQVCLAQC